MNPTPSDGAAGPSPDRAAPDPGEVDDHVDAAPDDNCEAPSGHDTDRVPAPRSGLRPLPRRARGTSAPGVVPEQEPGRDPDGRPYDAVDEETLNRLLSGLREI